MRPRRNRTSCSDRFAIKVRAFPDFRHLEVANVLLQAERVGRITTGDVATRLELIAELPIATDNETTQRAWREILALARAEGLTTYDASYLELAIRRALPLQTKDTALIAAQPFDAAQRFPADFATLRGLWGGVSQSRRRCGLSCEAGPAGGDRLPIEVAHDHDQA
jgi:predicted nucleic acid-binding protein